MAGVIYKVKSFEDLKNNMDIFEISPDIAWKHIVASKKLDLTDKTIWKMQKFNLYIEVRISAVEHAILKIKDKPEMKKYKMKDPKIIKNAVKYLIPKRKATIRTMIESKVYKILFDDFWKTIFNFDQSVESLQAQFETWFGANKPNKEETTTTAITTTAEGTTTNETIVSE
mgnify:CR=1 FL=1